MFNNKQLEAINALDGYVRIIAGAGSGKTSVLTERYTKLLENAYPSEILCVTFTNKAANEMRERIEKKTGELKYSLICTFHSFCLRVLREGISKLGYPNNFVILDNEDQKSILKKIYKECSIDYEVVSYTTAQAMIADEKILKEKHLLDLLAKDNTIEKLYEKAKTDLKKNKDLPFPIIQDLVKDCIYYGYLYYQQKNTSLDFNDLIIFTVLLFKEEPMILGRWQEKIKYIMVDEFQDASRRQYELVSMLSKRHGNLFVVGDPDQTIYSWRGARPEILVDFDKDWETKTIILNQNYRSTPNILRVANTLIANNKLRVEKDLFTERDEGPKVHYNHLSDNFEEAKFVGVMIKKALEKYRPKDIAVLYRMHFLSRGVEEQLIKNKIPYIIHSGVNFYERKEIKDILAYLRLINNPDDDLAFERIINVPKRGIGDKKIENLKQYVKLYGGSLWNAMVQTVKTENKNPYQDFMFAINYLKTKLRVDNFNLAEFTREVLKATKYQNLIENDFEKERKESIQELLKSMQESKNQNLDEYLQDIALLTNVDRKTSDCVSLMTIHASKGLEFPVVFVIGMSENVFPSGKADNELELEEERRLAYVAYTRAKNSLILTDSAGYTFQGDEKQTSRFIRELNEDDLVIMRKPLIGFLPKKLVRL